MSARTYYKITEKGKQNISDIALKSIIDNRGNEGELYKLISIYEKTITKNPVD